MPHLGAPLWRMMPDICLQLTLARPLSLEPLAKRKQSIEVVQVNVAQNQVNLAGDLDNPCPLAVDLPDVP